MKVTLLVDNCVRKKKCYAEHGFSVLIEDESASYLFDTGQTDVLLHNADVLNLPMNDLDGIILSHGHYDHCGGLIHLLETRSPSTTVYTGPGVFEPKYKIKGHKKYAIGIDRSQEEYEQSGAVFTTVSSEIKIAPDLHLIGGFQAQTPTGFCIEDKTTREMIEDPFDDEIVLVKLTSSGLCILTGCSHSGIIGIVQRVRQRFPKYPVWIIGGMHLEKVSDDRLSAMIKELSNLGVYRLTLCHCSGFNVIPFVKECGLSYDIGSVGDTFITEGGNT